LPSDSGAGNLKTRSKAFVKSGSHKEEKVREVIIFRGEDGYWVAECPSLPGCISQGETKEKAIENIKEAISLYIEALKEDSLPIPEETFEAMVVAV